MRNYSGPLTVPVIVIVLAAIAVVALGAWAVLGAETCLTKEQARAKWPGAWLYWHGSNRCWDNQRTATRQASAHTYSVNKNPLQLGKPPIDANGNDVHHSGRPLIPEKSSPVYYPSLIVGSGTTDDMLTPYVMSTWSPIADFDTDPPPFLPWQRISGLLTR